MAIDVEKLYLKYGPMVLRRTIALLKDEDLALDVMQDTFVQLINKKDQYDERYPSSMLYTIATNLCLNKIRNKANKKEVKDDILSYIANHDETEKITGFKAVINKIFKNQASTKEMAVMHFVDSMTYEEVAETIGLSVSGVRKRLRLFKEKISKLEEANELFR
ncbi:MAG: sigma-70 family RNA polymerase sigma factor [Pseudomonadota bacterium]